MFTGLVETTGTVDSIDGGRLSVRSGIPLEIAEGDSVAVNGVCLTASRVNGGGGFDADVMPETLRRTALGSLGEGDSVNLELALRAAQLYRDALIQAHPPLSQLASGARLSKSNLSGTSGLARIDRVELSGRPQRRLCWEAHCPMGQGRATRKRFSIRKRWPSMCNVSTPLPDTLIVRITNGSPGYARGRIVNGSPQR